MLNDNFDFPSTNDQCEETVPLNREGMPQDTEKYYALLKDAEQELYPNCETFTKISCIIRLLHLKVMNGWSNKSMTMLLILLKEMLPKGETLPNTYYEAKKVITRLGF